MLEIFNQCSFLCIEDAVTDDRISFLQCSECEHPPGFLGQIDIQEIDVDHLVNSNGHNICKPNIQ